MSIEANKKDFERSLEEMKETVELLKACVDDALIGTIESVINEYEGHYASDIEDMISLNSELENEIEDLKAEAE